MTRWIKNPGPSLTRNKPATKINMEALAQDIKKHPDAYQYERARRLGVSVQGINYARRRLGVSYKKSLKHLLPGRQAKRRREGKDKRRRTAYLLDSYKDV